MADTVADTAGDSVAVVVGVGPGLGSALVRRAAGDGMTVVAAARQATKLEALQSGPEVERVVPHDCDATSPEAVDTLFRAADELGRLDLVVFNAGAFAPGRIVDTDPAEFERCWRVGCFAGFLVGQQAARRMVRNGQGTIIFTGATASLRGSAGFANLASPKFALRAVAQSMARELGPMGVHVAHTIIDGQIRSARYQHLIAERGPDSLLEPDAIADAYLALHRQHRSAWTFELDLRPWVEKF
ncbi:MAG: SDR family NAD(P)-dependent oxidoreductase [Alphaproteobacteria bacterium]|nr:MAG: SDR family NAD(P)-dependent oxidoreductase [Alphaproteobacteria bacterium]